MGVVDARLEQQLARVDSARERRGKAKPGRDRAGPSAPNPAPRTPHPVVVDLDRAFAPEIEALPGIGPALAARIVAHRDSAGPFGSLGALCRVRGVGPAMVARLRPRVVFSGVSPEAGGCEQRPTRSSKSHVTNRGKVR